MTEWWRTMPNLSSDSKNGMTIYKLNPEEVRDLIRTLETSQYEVLVASDPIDSAFKIKIDGGRWSPPMGREL